MWLFGCNNVKPGGPGRTITFKINKRPVKLNKRPRNALWYLHFCADANTTVPLQVSPESLGPGSFPVNLG